MSRNNRSGHAPDCQCFWCDPAWLTPPEGGFSMPSDIDIGLPPVKEDTCTCPIRDLAAYGCKCGYLQRERERK